MKKNKELLSEYLERLKRSDETDFINKGTVSKQRSRFAKIVEKIKKRLVLCYKMCFRLDKLSEEDQEKLFNEWSRYKQKI